MEQTETIDPALLPHLLTLNEDELILPLKVKRQDVNKLRAVKLAEEEVSRVDAFQAYLHDRGYLPENSFAAVFVYCFNLAYTLHQRVAEREAEQEAPNGQT